MNKKTTQFRWMLTMLMLVVAMPTFAGLQSYDSNGFGSDGSYQPATLTTGKYDINGDGTKDDVYEISNAGQLYWFAGLVNGTLTDGTSQNTYANAVLVSDITVNSGVLKADGTLRDDPSGLRSWTPIGNFENSTLRRFLGFF